MISPDKLFGNLFTDPEITPARLFNFGQDALNKFIAANPAPPPEPQPLAKAAAHQDFTDIINQLTPPLQELQQQLSGVDTSVTQQRGATLNNNTVIVAFQDAMRNYEGVIANAVGGFKGTGYLQFYPHGLGEYTRATKVQLPVLMDRVKTAATTFATELGEPLATNLQNFATQWQTSRDAQQQQMGVVEDNRTGRTDAETDVQMALLFAIHSTAVFFPGDVVKCSSFFDFSLLLPQAHPHKTETFTGNVVENTTAVALNRSFTGKTHLRLTNTANNAALLVYLGATADAPSNGKGIEVDAGRSRNLKLNELGNEDSTFLLVKNLSDVNDAGYVLEVKD